MRSLKAKSPQAHDQLEHEQAGEDKPGVFKTLADGGNPGVVLDPLIAIDQGDEDISQQTRYIEGYKCQYQIVLLL